MKNAFFLEIGGDLLCIEGLHFAERNHYFLMR